ncbi:hypothetical protein [Beihai sobemo-like virus 19]|uniref:hypothetical protein n=1 Tax=Beihai sobemo-like virus 19 TaxID=1922690 RepID=UPI000909A3FB|nr:hypothetical protein [Beihai sobemo-like virus 19]APG75660.1 hypothetical protein [Beihai sobemo-like virus 19]
MAIPSFIASMYDLASEQFGVIGMLKPNLTLNWDYFQSKAPTSPPEVQTFAGQLLASIMVSVYSLYKSTDMIWAFLVGIVTSLNPNIRTSNLVRPFTIDKILSYAGLCTCAYWSYTAENVIMAFFAVVGMCQSAKLVIGHLWWCKNAWSASEHSDQIAGNSYFESMTADSSIKEDTKKMKCQAMACAGPYTGSPLVGQVIRLPSFMDDGELYCTPVHVLNDDVTHIVTHKSSVNIESVEPLPPARGFPDLAFLKLPNGTGAQLGMSEAVVSSIMGGETGMAHAMGVGSNFYERSSGRIIELERGGLAYLGSTLPGWSGAPYEVGGKVVGVHHVGIPSEGNLGYDILLAMKILEKQMQEPEYEKRKRGWKKKFRREKYPVADIRASNGYAISEHRIGGARTDIMWKIKNPKGKIVMLYYDDLTEEERSHIRGEMDWQGYSFESGPKPTTPVNAGLIEQVRNNLRAAQNAKRDLQTMSDLYQLANIRTRNGPLETAAQVGVDTQAINAAISELHLQMERFAELIEYYSAKSAEDIQNQKRMIRKKRNKEKPLVSQEVAAEIQRKQADINAALSRAAHLPPREQGGQIDDENDVEMPAYEKLSSHFVGRFKDKYGAIPREFLDDCSSGEESGEEEDSPTFSPTPSMEKSSLNVDQDASSTSCQTTKTDVERLKHLYMSKLHSGQMEATSGPQMINQTSLNRLKNTFNEDMRQLEVASLPMTPKLGRLQSAFDTSLGGSKTQFNYEQSGKKKRKSVHWKTSKKRNSQTSSKRSLTRNPVQESHTSTKDKQMQKSLDMSSSKDTQMSMASDRMQSTESGN